MLDRATDQEMKAHLDAKRVHAEWKYGPGSVELMKKFEHEKDLKNQAYFFLIDNNLLSAFEEYRAKNPVVHYDLRNMRTRQG